MQSTELVMEYLQDSAIERGKALQRERDQALLDQFAGQAMAALIDVKHSSSPETIAQMAYRQAKAMMAERERYRT